MHVIHLNYNVAEVSLENIEFWLGSMVLFVVLHVSEYDYLLFAILPLCDY